MHTSLPESIQYVSDSLLIGEEEKQNKSTIGIYVHMDPNGSDPGGMCQLRTKSDNRSVCKKGTIK